MATTAGAPPGSGKNFAALKSKLAARGATNPGALAAYIGRKKYGRKGFAKLSHHSHANDGDVMHYDFAGQTTQCPRCGYSGDNAEFKVGDRTADTSLDSSPEALRTIQKDDFGQGRGLPLTVRGASSPNMGLANGRGRSINLSRRLPVRQHVDLVVSRSPSGSHIVRHRQGGTTIGELRHNDDGTWQSVVDGNDLSPYRNQRTALLEMLGVYNRTTVTPDRAAQPLVPAPTQTPLMERFGVPAIRLASDYDSDDASDSGDGLKPNGQRIYKKLRGKGVSDKVAKAMAMRSQDGPPGRKAS